MRYEIGFANRLGNRTINEDRYAIEETPEGVLLVLADGMGGHIAGEMAAQTLVDMVRQAYRRSRRPLGDPGRFFQQTFLEAHRLLLHQARAETYENFPGTTAVACIIEEGRINWAHVGDSRLYVFRNGLTIFRTRDHSYVEKLYQQGIITLSEQANHPRRNQITQCIGCQIQDPRIELGRSRILAEGDVVLLCSDGLWEAVDDARMGSLLSHSMPLSAAIDNLATTAEQCAYPNSDNVSVVAIRFIARHQHRVERPAAERAPTPPPPPPQAEPSGERLQDAISVIEQVAKEYEKEIKH